MYSKRATTTNWHGEKKKKPEPGRVLLSAVQSSSQTRSMTIHCKVMDKTAEKMNAMGKFVILTLWEDDVVISMYLNGKLVDSSKEIEIGKKYAFFLHAVVVRDAYDRTVGARQTFYGQGLQVKEMTFKQLTENQDFKFESLSAALAKAPTFMEPVKFIFVTASLKTIEGKAVPAELRCTACHGPLRASPPDDDGDITYVCDHCRRTFDESSVERVFTSYWVILKDEDKEIQVILSGEVVQELSGHDANYFFAKKEEPVLDIGSSTMKWVLKAVFSRFQESSQIGYFVCKYDGPVLDDYTEWNADDATETNGNPEHQPPTDLATNGANISDNSLTSGDNNDEDHGTPTTSGDKDAVEQNQRQLYRSFCAKRKWNELDVTNETDKTLNDLSCLHFPSFAQETTARVTFVRSHQNGHNDADPETAAAAKDDNQDEQDRRQLHRLFCGEQINPFERLNCLRCSQSHGNIIRESGNKESQNGEAASLGSSLSVGQSRKNEADSGCIGNLKDQYGQNVGDSEKSGPKKFKSGRI